MVNRPGSETQCHFFVTMQSALVNELLKVTARMPASQAFKETSKNTHICDMPQVCDMSVTQETVAFFRQLRVVVLMSPSTSKVPVSTRRNEKVFLMGKSGIW